MSLAGSVEETLVQSLTAFAQTQERLYAIGEMTHAQLLEFIREFDRICQRLRAALSTCYKRGGDYAVIDMLLEKLYTLVICQLTVTVVKRIISKPRPMQNQMAETDKQAGQLSDSSKHQTLLFESADPQHMVYYGGESDATRYITDTPDVTLSRFFERPIVIHEENWAVNTALDFKINPWSLYLDNPRVVNRISNYHNLRADLHIRILLNGNGFFFGRAMAGYHPFDTLDPFSDFPGTPMSLTQLSQHPKIFLNPTHNQGGEMRIPFHAYTNYLAIPEASWDDLGSLIVRSMGSLKHANGADTDVTVTVFAYLTNVELATPTSAEPRTMVPQMAEINQANANGVVSGPATTVGKIAGALTSIPTIAPFAKATQMIANTTASVAKMFGYSRPQLTKVPEPYQPVATASLALTTVPDVAHKMTVDDKQELTIDPRVAGMTPDDPLVISSIARRESYLTSFTWATSASRGDLLWRCRVDPCVWNTDGAGYNFTALAMAALPFKYWTGSLKFRFQFAGSAFHKGRIRIVYDPDYVEGEDYNTNYQEIVELTDHADFTITIGNGQEVSLLDHVDPGEATTSDLYRTSSWPPGEEVGPGNGEIALKVVNELTVPNSVADNDIQVHVFISAGPDFEVFVPDDGFQKFVFEPQMAGDALPRIAQTDADNEENNAPMQEQSTSMAVGWSNHKDLNSIYTGESITSFRTLLKRYNHHGTLPYVSGTATTRIAGARPAFPYLRGNVAGAVDTTGAGAPYNYVDTTLLHWVTYAFAGWRGSIRWKILPRGHIQDSRYFAFIERGDVKDAKYSDSEEQNYQADYTNESTVKYYSMNVKDPSGLVTTNSPSGARGAVYQSAVVNSAIEFEMPFYSKIRFIPGKTENWTSGLLGGAQLEPWNYRVYMHGTRATVLETWCAAGEDYQVYMFTGLCRMYYEPNPPLPVAVP